jgi:O-antigen ligase
LIIRLLERGFFIVLFFYLMGTATAIFNADVDQDQALALQGTLHWQIAIIQSALAAIAMLLILTRWRRVAGAALKAWPLLALAGLQLLSVVWSIHPLLTLRKDVLEIVMLFMGIYLGERYTTEEFSRMLAQVLCMAMAAIFVLFFVARHFVLDHSERFALKGLSQNKNGFGFYIGLTAALLLIIRFRKHDWLRYLGIPVAFGMLLLSRSITSVVTAVLIIATLPMWFAARLPARQRLVGYLVLTIVLVGSCVLAQVYSEPLLALVGRDSTFTGRTEVWKQLLVAIGHHPILGYGYGAFWTGLTGESLDVLAVAGWIVPSAHNAYLELWIALGIPGMIVGAFIFWQAFRLSLDYIRTERGLYSLWPVACICFILIHGIGESEFIYDASFASCLFSAVFTSLVLDRARARSSSVPRPLPYPGAAPLAYMTHPRSAAVRS